MPIQPLTNKRLSYWVNKIKTRLLVQWLSYALLPSLGVAAVVYWTNSSMLFALLSMSLLLLAAGFLVTQTKQYKDIDAKSLLLHLNRVFTPCEESAELLLQTDDSLSLMQRLQKQRIQPVVEDILLRDLREHLPVYPIKKPILLTLLLLLAFFVIQQREVLFSLIQSPKVMDNQRAPGFTKQTAEIVAAQITVFPAPYTKLPEGQFSDLDFNLVAGSRVNWQLSLTNIAPDKPLLLHINDQQSIPLIEQQDGRYAADADLTQSAVYFISQDQQMIGDIHTIEVTQDRRPTIRFITPTNTITEFSKNAVAKMQSTVEISDDFALGKVEILASVASGSGEAVKFRDQTFEFDTQQQVAGKTHFIKEWDLAALNMQPGDELYFSVRAWDNRTPTPQQSRSPNKIIRWLEDQTQGVMVDGLLMDFMPEYFKSQRQIIIETEQLIAEQESVSQQDFEKRSRDLGAAQSDLKQKYGQFLGDEFDSGTMHEMEQGLDFHPVSHAEGDTDDDGSHSSESASASATASALASEHEHQPEAGDHPEDKSGYSQIIEQYGHAHGEADDGNFIKKGIPSPKLLMKRAIGNMWQAELFLQLSQPEKALPFENNALELINRAKKAERIYVKRLGFEPPPVSEKRRYQGDLTDILSYERNQQHDLPSPISADFKTLLNRLNQRALQPESTVLNDADLIVIQKIKDYFSTHLDQAPEYIKLIASLQKIQSTKTLQLQNCNNCIKDLQSVLWQLLPSPIAAPKLRKNTYSNKNEIIQSYQQFILQQKQGTQP